MGIALHPALQAMRDERAKLVAAFRGRELDGPELHRALSRAMDDAIRAVWRSLPVPASDVSLVALGGYGRGLLALGSDVDLMILHRNSDAVREAQALFYALWDAGLKVGHAIRTPKESLALARENVEAETSFLDARLLDGDPQLYERFAQAAVEQTRGRGPRFVADVRELMRIRHAAHGSATSQLEPNIKEGTGGLRDLHVLDWFQAATGDLVEQRFLDEEDRKELEAAHTFLMTVRTELHLATSGTNDTLLFQLQRPIAESLGYADGRAIAEDAFMRDLFKATRAIELTVNSIAADLASRNAKPKRGADRAGPFVVAGDRVLLEGDLDLVRRPEDALTLFGFGVMPGAVAMRSARRALRDITLPITPEVKRAFVALLASAPGTLLEMADHAGVFAALFPEWDAVRLQPQRNIYHLYTVDAHLFHAAEAMGALLRSPDDPIVERVVADLDEADRELVLMAALFHDVGKGSDEEHCERGERLARDIAIRLALDHEHAADLAWLVREHLLLVVTATRRDLSDPSLLEDIAGKVGTQRRARLLFLLTIADGIGTGPTAWTPWKADLVTELFTKVIHVLDRGALATSDLANEARDRMRAAEQAAGPDAEVVAAHLAAMPKAYVLRFAPDALVRHAVLMRGLEANEIRAAHGTLGDGSAELTVVTNDKPGLFRRASGVLALHALSIVTSEVHTRDDGLALEWFRCVGPRGLPVEEDRWGRIERDLDRALHGRLAIEARLAEKRAEDLRRSRGKQEPTKVLCDLEASAAMTIVEVHATDRLGLLHDITAALEDCGLDVYRAKIATYGDDVVDVFYVRDLDGDKIVEPTHLAEIERSILHRVG